MANFTDPQKWAKIGILAHFWSFIGHFWECFYSKMTPKMTIYWSFCAVLAILGVLKITPKMTSFRPRVSQILASVFPIPVGLRPKSRIRLCRILPSRCFHRKNSPKWGAGLRASIPLRPGLVLLRRARPTSDVHFCGGTIGKVNFGKAEFWTWVAFLLKRFIFGQNLSSPSSVVFLRKTTCRCAGFAVKSVRPDAEQLIVLLTQGRALRRGAGEILLRKIFFPNLLLSSIQGGGCTPSLDPPRVG